MTMHEFEAWVSDNYDELAKLAHQVVRRANAVDLLHSLIEAICDGRAALPECSVEKLTVGLFAKPLRLDAWNAARDSNGQAQSAERFGESLSVLGADTYIDTTEQSARAGHRRRKLKAEGRLARVCRVEAEAASAVTPGNLFYGATGTTRWRYQTLRDNRLFDGRAIRSLSESMHKASQRIRHDGEPGFSYTEFGAENGQAWSAQENAR